jgi:CheY-like chemotaxis protein/predicted Ser/Thr protein kinase
MTGPRRPIWSDATMPISASAEHRIAVSRYRLRAAAHRIAADCERMLESLDRPERHLWREAVGGALVASRQLLAVIGHSGPSRDDPAEFFAHLHEQIFEPQRRIVDCMNSLLGFVPTSPEDALILEDGRAIREAAVELWALDDAGPSAAGRGAARQAGAGAPASDQTRPRLLIADDDSAQRRALRALLERLGYEIEEAEDGRAALDLVERRAPDLILTDLNMPELDGFELLRRLKAADHSRNIPVIVVSGADDVESVVRCIERGAVDHVTKPYEPVILAARVRASLEHKRMRDQELGYLRRVGTLSAAAEAVERDAYQPGSLDGIGSDDDELGRLARVFDRMVTSMRSREERLERRLGQLRQEMQEARLRGSGSHVEISDDSPFAAGQVIAERYEVLGELGKGGMGMVYHARDHELGEEIALKVVRQDLVAQDPSLVERLKSEIRLARRISHRNVVRAHDLGEWKGVHFLTMEYVKGITVEELLNTQGTLTVESTLAIGSQLAEALAVAHEQQIIHRDIKPGNLLVDDEGRLKVMDFGLARLEAGGGRHTRAGFVVGTPGYLAPELILGGEADARSDLFSAGAVLYECLTGRPPFDAASPMKVVDRVLAGGHEPIRTRAPATPAALIALIERLLAREPQDRIGSARELGDQLEQLGAARA